jgi:hypothetical protein
VARISADPAATAEANPALETVATAVLELLQVKVAPSPVFPNSSSAAAENCWLSSISNVDRGGVTWMRPPDPALPQP